MVTFSQILQPYQGQKIAIYGLSVQTENILSNWVWGCEMIGLLDGYRTSGELYGKPIISMEYAAASGVKLVLVAARPDSCKVIAKRIEKICRENHIAVLDCQGNNLLARKTASYHFAAGTGITKAQLSRLITRYDAVSVDLFDTLVMRQTLFPTDTFELTDCYLRKKGIEIEDFAQKRLGSEKYLSRSGNPTLQEIYAYMLEQYSISSADAETLARLEWSVDRNLIVPREELCEFLREISRQGKPVYIVSDTFYTKNQLAQLLEKCGFTCYTDILSSCDCQTSKTQQLFERLKDRLQGKSCIHIGDSVVADVESAEKHGIAACRIYSGLDLLEQVGYLELWDQIGSLSSRVRTGMLAARLLNSPFQFESEKTEMCIKQAGDIGFLLFAPLICEFVFWLHRQIQSSHIENIWFSARDGYLIKKLYDRLESPANSVYFLTSRTAAIRAGLENEEDIRYVEEMRFSGTLREQLAERFGLQLPDTEPVSGNLAAYTDAILEKARISRENYQAYIQQLEMRDGNIAFFDFVARGTVQMYVDRLVPNPITGFYFLQLDQKYMEDKGLHIVPFYLEDEREHSNIFQNYYILETILTSPEPTVLEFGEKGVPCYAKETRKENQLNCIQEVQNGIMEYFQTYVSLFPDWMYTDDKSLGEAILSLIHKIRISDKTFLELAVEDPFFHRITKVSDLL